MRSAPSTFVLTILVATWIGTAGTGARADFAPHGGIFRDPDVGPTHVVFVYADDLWVVPREGGTALPLASPDGLETTPRFSPDGSQVAFGAAYDGNPDLYVLPLAGGVPTRVTYHPAEERLSDWTADGRLLFSMSGLAGLDRMPQLFTVPAVGGLPERLPVPYGGLGALHPDGRRLAYVPQGGDHPSWKRYRGGRASDVWTFDLEKRTSCRVTDWEGTDTWPLWHGERLYFVSDAGPEHRWNLWCHDLATGTTRQVTRYEGEDVRSPAMGPGPAGRGEIVFQVGDGLCLLDLATETVATVPVTIPGARPTLRPQRVDASRTIQRWRIGPTGKRAVVSARGDVWTLPAEEGVPRNLTRTSGVAERDPAWSPDGRRIAYVSDESGEYEIWVRAADGTGEPRRLTDGLGTFPFRPTWSPDSRRIAFTDKGGHLHVLEVETGTTTAVDQDALVDEEGMESWSWSPDSRWLVYAKASVRARNRRVVLHDTTTGTTTPLTGGRFDDHHPTFDRKGDFLYLASSRHFSPRYADLDSTWIYADTQVLLMVPLRRDVASPFLPKSDEEPAEAAGEAAPDAPGEGPAGEATPPAPPGEDDGVSGTWEGTATGDLLPPGGLSFTLSIRLDAGGRASGNLSLPVGTATIVGGSYDRASGRLDLELADDEGNAWRIEATVEGEGVKGRATLPSGGLVVAFEGRRTARVTATGPSAGEDRPPPGAPAKAVAIDVEGFEARAILLPAKPGRFGPLAVNDRGALLYGRDPIPGDDEEERIQILDPFADEPKEQDVARGTRDFVVSADGKRVLVVRGDAATIQAASAGDAGKGVVTRGMDALVDPRAEWRQIVRDAWRILREYFYDPTMHGLDWPSVLATYLPRVEDCATREDVAYVIREMIGELNVGHANHWVRPPWRRERPESVGLLGVDWALEDGAYRIARILKGAPGDADARGPLDQPGLDVREGDWVLAVDGVAVDPRVAPWAAFLGTAGRPTTLTVSAKPVIDGEARKVVVTPVGDEDGLRYRAWVEANRRKVEAASGGTVGYVHVPNTGWRGQDELVRQVQGQLDLDALIVDERWNGGGQLPDRFVELLDRPVRNHWARRDGLDWPTPHFAHQGPKCMLINGSAGSGGDAFPYYFRQSGLGPLVGTRTWGGLVGISGNPSLVDGTHVSVPTFAFYETDGTWGIEGHGVDPDVEVVDDPARMQDGADPQLDRAVELMLEAVRTGPYRPPARPAYPVRSGMGIPPAER